VRRAARPVMYLGVLGAVFGLALVHSNYIDDYPFTGTSRFVWTVAYAALLCLAAYGFGLPDVPRTKRSLLGASVGAAVTGAVAISLVQLFVGDALLPRFVVFGSAIILPDWFHVCGRLAAGGRQRAEGRDRVVVVARGDEVDALVEDLAKNPERPAAVVASLGHQDAHGDGAARPLVDAAVAEGATVVVLDRRAQEDEAIVGQAAELHAAGLRIRTLSLFYEQWLGKLPISELERVSLLFDIGELHRGGYQQTKRLLDIALAVAGAVVLAVTMPLVVVGNLVANRGPLLYRQERVGKGGRVFTILKLRTMIPDTTEPATGEWTVRDDPRVTRFGRLLRVTHLDELPQVLNVLRGDLSVVGPRPEQPHYVSELREKLPFYKLRHLVRPGMTGWAQVKYGYAGDERDALEKLQYEFWYLRRQSLGTDVRIVGRTVRSVLGSEGKGR
jgi:lipopolysaccharide/colanic/teichoic acid biosynthesis glycosyltransferase